MTDLYWDEVLLTNNPDSKELEVSFKKIDGDGYLLSAGEEPGTPGGVIQGTDGAQSPELDDEGDFETIVPPIDGDVEPEGTPIPPSSPADECGEYDCDAFVDSILSLDSNISWHMWPTQVEVERAQTKGPALQDEYGNTMPDVWYYNNARGDITSTTARYDTPSTALGPDGEDIAASPLNTASQLRPCGVWARSSGLGGVVLEHDIEGYQDDIDTAFVNPSAGANRNFSFTVDFDFNWYWEWGEDSTLFDPSNVTDSENIYIACNYTPTAWKALGGPTETIQVALGGPGFKFYPKGGKIKVGPRGASDSIYTEARPASGTDIYPISGWWRMQYSTAVIVAPDPQYASLCRVSYTTEVTVHSPMGTVTHSISESNTGKQVFSPILVRDWAMVGALGVSVYSVPTHFPDSGLVICSSPTTVDNRTKQVIERLRKGYTPPTYCSRIP